MTNKKSYFFFKKPVKKKSGRTLIHSVLFTAMLFPSFVFPDNSDETRDIKKSTILTASYTTVTPAGEEIICTISSNDNIEKLNSLKKYGCNLSTLPVSQNNKIIIQSQNSSGSILSVLSNPQTLLRTAHTALHIRKIYESAIGLWTARDPCPCSGSLTGPSIAGDYPRIATKGLFLAYYLISLGYHAWPLISSYFYEEQKATAQFDAQEERLSRATKKDEDTWFSYLQDTFYQTASHPYITPLLTIAMDAAALLFDCKCPAYFYYPMDYRVSAKRGEFYFNGHLWMLLLNVADFATELTL